MFILSSQQDYSARWDFNVVLRRIPNSFTPTLNV